MKRSACHCGRVRVIVRLDNGPDELAAYLRSQTEKLAKVIKTLGVKAP